MDSARRWSVSLSLSIVLHWHAVSLYVNVAVGLPYCCELQLSALTFWHSCLSLSFVIRRCWHVDIPRSDNDCTLSHLRHLHCRFAPSSTNRIIHSCRHGHGCKLK